MDAFFLLALLTQESCFYQSSNLVWLMGGLNHLLSGGQSTLSENCPQRPTIVEPLPEWQTCLCKCFVFITPSSSYPLEQRAKESVSTVFFKKCYNGKTTAYGLREPSTSRSYDPPPPHQELGLHGPTRRPQTHLLAENPPEKSVLNRQVTSIFRMETFLNTTWIGYTFTVARMRLSFETA